MDSSESNFFFVECVMKFQYLLFIIIVSCNNSAKNQSETTIDKIENTDTISESEPLSYEDLKTEFKDSSTAINETLSRMIFEKVYPLKKTPKTNFDFEGLDLGQLKIAYSRFAKIVSNHKDSSLDYLPSIELGYSKLESRFATLSIDTTLNIKDKLEITSLKSDINTGIAEIKIRKSRK